MLSTGCGCECTTRIFDAAQKVFDLCVDEAAQCEIKLPSCQEILAGDIVHTTEKLAVAMSTVVTGLPNAVNPQTPALDAYSWACDPSWTLNITIEVVRCGPKIDGSTGKVTPEAEAAVAKLRAQDAFLMMKVAKAYAKDSIGAVPITIVFPNRQDYVSTVGTLSVAVDAPTCSHPQGA
jgi:hypothetical protein